MGYLSKGSQYKVCKHIFNFPNYANISKLFLAISTCSQPVL